MRFEPTDVLVDLDPRLQRLVERKRRGISTMASSSTMRDEVAVIARVKDVASWQKISEVREGADLGPARTEGRIVTGRIPIAQIEAVRRAPAVLSLKPPRPVRPTLAATIQDIHARKDLL